MRNSAAKARLLLFGTILIPHSAWGAETAPKVFLLDAAQLQQTRQRLRDGDQQLAEARDTLVERANNALRSGPYSVVEKEVVPPSGDKHDYMSLAPYWWPNPDAADGLPYIRRDGERNPEIHKLRNRADLGEMADAVEALALAYYFTGEEKYAAHAAQLIRAWFLDPKTRMNPHLNYGQAVRGVNEGRGEGLIESRAFVRVIDAVVLLEASDAWKKEDGDRLREWIRDFRQWMAASPHGRYEADADNNHGTFYDVQLATYSLFIGEREQAREVLQAARDKRIAKQIEPDGRQPLELARTKAWSYSIGNLAGLMALARLGEHVDVDLWRFETKDGRSIRKALDFLTPFALEGKRWPYEQINGFSPELAYPLIRVATAKYPDGPYGDMLAKLNAKSQAPAFLWLSPMQPTSDLHRR